MNKTAIFAFIFGAVVGAAITWKIAAAKYERMLTEELDNFYDDVERQAESEEEREVPVYTTNRRQSKPIDDKPDLMDKYAEVLKKTGYKKEEPEEGGDIMMNDKPYVISPDEYGENDYDCESLTYYADGVLTDDWDHPIEDVEGLVGVESLTHFGEYEEDSVYVRNDRYKTDYEILKDLRNFSEIPNHDYTVHDE